MDALEAVGDPELRAALLFARGQARPVTADELAAEAGVHRNVARSRLERLAEAGLLEPGYERRTGRSGPGAGRPAKTYAVAPELAAIQFPDRRYERLFALVLELVPQATLPQVGAVLGDALAVEAGIRPAVTVAEAAEAVCAGMRRLGFQASVVSAGEAEAVLETPTCPLRPLVCTSDDAALVDRGFWGAFAARALGRESAETACETHDCLVEGAPCKVRLLLNTSA